MANKRKSWDENLMGGITPSNYHMKGVQTYNLTQKSIQKRSFVPLKRFEKLDGKFQHAIIEIPNEIRLISPIRHEVINENNVSIKLPYSFNFALRYWGVPITPL